MYNGVTPMNLTHVLPGMYRLASIPDISKEAKQRLKWMDYYRQTKNASQVCRYFGISRKTFYSWKKRYNPYKLESLEQRSKRPKNTRQWEVSRVQELQILTLRRKYIRYGKEKLRRLYQQAYQESISSWKIQRVIEKHSLYYSPTKTLALRRRRRLNQPKKRITELKRELRQGFLIAFDGLTIYWNSIKRYVFTALDVHSKIAFARMYPTKSSKHGADFLQRINYLLEGKMENIQTDNGSEFAKHFKELLHNFFLLQKLLVRNIFMRSFNQQF